MTGGGGAGQLPSGVGAAASCRKAARGGQVGRCAVAELGLAAARPCLGKVRRVDGEGRRHAHVSAAWTPGTWVRSGGVSGAPAFGGGGSSGARARGGGATARQRLAEETRWLAGCMRGEDRRLAGWRP